MFRVKQILLNLLGNAVKFTDKGYVKLFLDRVDSEFIKIKVEDTGIGISDEAQKIIFDSFMQVDSGINKNYEGTGLGLAITKELVELMDGTISLKSKENEGTEVEVVLKLPKIEAFDEQQIVHSIDRESLYFCNTREVVEKKEALSFEKKQRLLEMFCTFVKSHQAKDAKDMLTELLRHKLDTKEEELLLLIQGMLEKRKYRLIMETMNEKADYSCS